MFRHFANNILIKDTELKQVAYFFLFFVILGCGTALGRGATDVLFFKRYGIEYLPQMYILLSFVLCGVSLGYAAYADRISAERFFKIIFFSLISLLVINWLLMSYSNNDAVYPFSFLVYEVSSELLIVHSMLYFSQNFETMQVKRILPVVLAGTQIGVFLGGLLLANISHSIGVQNVLLVWCLMICCTFMLMQWWHRRHGDSVFFRAGYKGNKKLPQAIKQVTQGVRFMKTSPLLRASSFALFFMVITFYVLCYSVLRIYNSTFTTEESLSTFFGYLTATTGLITFTLQVFVTNRVIRHFGAKRVNLFFPVSSIFSYFILLFSFTLPAAIIGSLNKDTVMQAFRNPVRNIFINALPSNMQGRARAMSIAIVLPLALSLCGILLWFMQRMESQNYFLMFGFSAGVMYLYFNNRMNKEYVSEIVASLKQKLYIPGSNVDLDNVKNEEEAFNEIIKGVLHEDQHLSVSYARMLISSFPEKAVDIILEKIKNSDDVTQDQLIKLLEPMNSTKLHSYLFTAYNNADDHLKATILSTLFSMRNGGAKVFVQAALEHQNPRVKAVGIKGALSYRMKSLMPETFANWKYLLVSDELNDNVAALDLLELSSLTKEKDELVTLYKNMIDKLLSVAPLRIKIHTLNIMEKWPEQTIQSLAPQLEKLYSDDNYELKLASIRRVHLLDDKERDNLVTKALEDGNYEVREAAVNAILEYDLHASELLIKWLIVDNKGSPRAQQAMLNGLVKLNLPKMVFEDIALSKARNAQEFVQAIDLLRNTDYKKSSATELMLFTMQEKLQQTMDLTLLAIQTFELPDKFAMVRAGLKSKDIRLIGHACEVLSYMENKTLAKILGSILDSVGKQEKMDFTRNLPFDNVNGMLNWYEKQTDPWLQSCATESLKATTYLEPANDRPV